MRNPIAYLNALLMPTITVDEVSNFVWTTNDGLDMRVGAMRTGHIFNCVKMIYNHTVPEHLTINPYKKWDLSHMSGRYRRVALTVFLRELAKSTDLGLWERAQLRVMPERLLRWRDKTLNPMLLEDARF